MKICILAQYFAPTTNACSVRMAAFARGLRDSGHEVTVLAGMPNYPTGIKPPAYRWRLYKRENWDGITVHRTYEFASANAGYIRRSLNYLSFMFSAMFGVFFLPRCDVLIVSSPPLFITLSARVIAAFKARHLVVDVRDLWPRIVCELGHAKPESLGMRWLRHLELRAYRAASLITAATGGLRREIDTTCREVIGVEREVMFCANGIVDGLPLKASDYTPDSDSFTLVFAGTLTPHYDFHQVLDFAAELQREEEPSLQRVRVLLVGDGDLREELEARVAGDKLENVCMRGWTPHDEMLDIVAKCDACIVPLFTGGLFDCALPVKMFEGMYCSLPIVTNGVAELRELLSEADCAYFFESRDYASFRSCLLDAVRDPEERERRGAAGRETVLRDFERGKIAKRLASHLAERFDSGQ